MCAQRVELSRGRYHRCGLDVHAVLNAPFIRLFARTLSLRVGRLGREMPRLT